MVNRFNSDYASGTGFYECIPARQKSVIRISCPHGILIPFNTSEIHEIGGASEIIDNYYILASIYKQLYEDLDL